MLKSSHEEKQRSQVIRTGRLVLVPQAKLPAFLEIESGDLAHQRLAVARHETETGTGDEVDLLQLLSRHFSPAEIEDESAEPRVGKRTAVCKLSPLQCLRFHKRHVHARSEVDVLVHHQDGSLAVEGVREERGTLAKEVVLHEVGAGVGEEGGGVVVEGEDQFVYVSRETIQLGSEGVWVSAGLYKLSNKHNVASKGRFQAARLQLQVEIDEARVVVVATVLDVGQLGKIKKEKVVTEVVIRERVDRSGCIFSVEPGGPLWEADGSILQRGRA